MAPFDRQSFMKRLHEMASERIPIIGGGAGTGLSAKCEEAGGIDIVIVYNSGRYRMAGRASSAGLLAYGNANAIVKEMAAEILPVIKQTPVLAGVNATDPFVNLPNLLSELKQLGYAGVQNFPTIGIIDGDFRLSLEETGISYDQEVGMIEIANGMDLLTTPYVFSSEEAVAMARAGADIIVAHMGVTVGGSIGAKSGKTLDQSIELISSWAEAARSVRDDILVLCHGGPIATPSDAEYILSHCPACNGFYGASSMERLPVERAITQEIETFKRISLATP
ncbi:phosphoenolpyruvate hydrolase family protein [Fodinicurvata halophila]|uniref:Phosphoenolpyruvate hydrolase family protein n=1 Tax=Fodinicurvata halophila TaxID=1419723 RepID=A0ABV8UJV0_9PROT